MMPEKTHKSGFRGPSPDVGKSTQFKPGVCMNPGGRPKKRPITQALERQLTLEAADKIAEALIKQAQRATRGGILAAKEIADRLEGRALEHLQATVQTTLSSLTDEELQQRFAELATELGYVHRSE